MKIEFLPTGSAHCPLIRISDFDPPGARRLKEELAKLANGQAESVSLDEPGETATADSCHVTAQVGKSDEGILRVRDDPHSFVWLLRPITWGNVVALIEPFCQSDTRSFQWLDSPSQISVVLTPTGAW